MKIICDDIVLNREETVRDEIKQIALMEGVVQNLTEKWTYPENLPDSISFTILQDDQVIGQAAFKSVRWFNRKAEMSLFIHPDHQKRGIGTRILKSLINHAFLQLNFHRLEAEVNEYNQAGLKLMEKLGFKQEGRLREARFFKGRYYDIFRFGLLSTDFESSR